MAPALSAEPSPAPRSGTHWIVWIFAVVGLLGALAFIALAVMIFGGGSRQPPAAVVAETSAGRFVVRDAEPIRGTNLVRISIAAGMERSPYSSGGMEDERNILLLDRTSGAVRRLLPDNGRQIARSYFLPARAEASADPSDEITQNRDGTGGDSQLPSPPAYFALLVAQPDHGDRFDLVIGALADEQHGFTMPGLAGVDGVWMQSSTQIALIVREGLNLFYRIVDIPSRRILLSRRIAI